MFNARVRVHSTRANDRFPLLTTEHNINLVKKFVSAMGPLRGSSNDFHLAAWTGDDDFIETYIQQGGDVNILADNKLTALHLATWNMHSDVVSLLLECPVIQVSAGDVHQESALHFAAWNGDEECAELLLEAGAIVNSRNKYGQTPMHFAAATGNVQIIETLISAGGSIQEQDKIGQTPIQYAARFRQSGAMEILTGVEVGLSTLDFSEPTFSNTLASKW